MQTGRLLSSYIIDGRKKSKSGLTSARERTLMGFPQFTVFPEKRGLLSRLVGAKKKRLGLLNATPKAQGGQNECN